uniref:Uncharacterized protein n=1 Tax=Fundulus heteroclitus TaxID=8078 RepID=A0A3Q2PVT7_FUNHE
MPARSPGKAGRSRGPAAPSYSSTCFRTEGGGRHKNRRETAPGPIKTSTRISFRNIDQIRRSTYLPVTAFSLLGAQSFCK